ncbi:MAG: S8 family peptidase [Chloroflexota bacterium]|nr:S8 family peptidase [Chloroflexota bacterium]
MAKQLGGKAASANWSGPARLFLLVTMLLTMVGLAPAAEAAPKVQPILLQMAAQQPDQKVSIIVQTTGKSDGPEKLVTRLGGEVTKDLHIINAFAASVSAKNVAQIGKANDVRWVSLDAAVSQSSTPTQFTTWATAMGAPVTATIGSNFNGTAIRAGNYIWFNSVLSASGLGSSIAKVNFDNAAITFSVSGSNYMLKVPNATITFDPAASAAATSYITATNTFSTVVRTGTSGNTYLTSIGYRVPADLPGGINPVTMSGRFTSDTPGISVNWKWAAAVYTTFSANYNALGIKPVDSNSASVYKNSDQAGTPENYKSYVTGGARGGGGSSYVGGYSGSTQSVAATAVFSNTPNIIDSEGGLNGTYGSGSNSTMAVAGFQAEKAPGNSITKVEAVLRAYVPAALGTGEDPILTASMNSNAGTGVTVNHTLLNTYLGSANAGTLYVDITASRTWTWSDFDPNSNLQLTVNQTHLAAAHSVYYDAIGLRVSTAAGTDTSGGVQTSSQSMNSPVDTSRLNNVYNTVTGATNVWNEGPGYLQGSGTTVAVVDSGILYTKDWSKRLIANVNFNAAYHNAADAYGHGTFVAGVIAGDGTMSNGTYMGMAPQTNLVNVRVSDDQGMAYESDVVNGLQWVHDNMGTYKIKVVNLSLNSGVAESYNTSPLDAACEILWFDGVVVVASSGNNGTANLYAPANDPFVITVGAVDDQGTPSTADDSVASYSAYGTDETAQAKPDIVTSGSNIISVLPDNGMLTISANHPANRVNSQYFRMSGTSMAAPMVSGAVALLLQDEPNLTPDQVKYRLKATAKHDTTLWPGYNATTAGAGYLNIYGAVHGTTTASANTGLTASHMLWTGTAPLTWNSVNWNSVNWNSVNWNSVNWNSVNWNSVNWNSDYWAR